MLEEGRVLFDMRSAKYSIANEHGRCTLQLWSEDANLVRRVIAVEERGGVLCLSVLRFGQVRPQTLGDGRRA